MQPGPQINRDRSRPRAVTGIRSNLIGLLVPLVFLALPLFALRHRALDLRWVTGYVLAVSALTYWAYAVDKRRSQAGEWRIPEMRLHLLECAGGWPGAFLAQRRLRHKSAKFSYQLSFWLIVGAHQFAAFDSLQNWQLSRAGLNWLESTSKYRK